MLIRFHCIYSLHILKKYVFSTTSIQIIIRYILIVYGITKKNIRIITGGNAYTIDEPFFKELQILRMNDLYTISFDSYIINYLLMFYNIRCDI